MAGRALLHQQQLPLGRILLLPPGAILPSLRLARSPSSQLRPASTKPDPSKPIVLEQPTKFNPPSHGSRSAWRMPKVYGPRMTEQEKQESSRRDYPGLMAPPGTWQHWFLNTWWIHTVITIGTLAALALTSWYLNFKYYSPYRHMIPPIDDIMYRPVEWFTTWRRALVLDGAYRQEQQMLRYAKKVDDPSKRLLFMKEHNLNQEDRFTKYFGEWEDPVDKQFVELKRKKKEKAEAEARALVEAAAGGGSGAAAKSDGSKA